MSSLWGNLTGAGSHLGVFTQYAVWIALAMFAIGLLLCTWRLLRGPDIEDRILALDAGYMNAIAIVVLFGILFNSPLLFEAALVVALLGFISTVVLARFISSGDVAE